MKRLLLPLLISCTWLLASAAAPQNADKAVVILVVEFNDAPKDIGTGFFVDHDGLIATADHVIRGLAIVGTGSSSPTQTKHPKRITVYSTSLSKTWTVDIGASPERVVSGQIMPGKWVDVALFRVDLDSNIRTQITPLDSLVDAVPTGAMVYAYGPNCTNPENPDCLQPVVLPASIMNPVERARAYITNATATPGYSGGPLVDDAGRVLGIGSTLATIGLSDFGARATYVPISYLVRYLGLRPPKSSFFADPNVCSNIGAFHTLTLLDVNQISPAWTSNATLTDPQCRCCCDSLTKAPAALLTTNLTNTGCAPPFCAEQRVFGLLRSVAMTLHDPEVSSAELNAAVDTARAVYHDIVSTQQLSTQQRASLLRTLGGVLGQVSPSWPSDIPKRQDAWSTDWLALSAFLQSEKLQQSPAVYEAMRPLLLRNHLLTLDTAAGILADYSYKVQLDPDGAAKSLKELNIDHGKLQKSLEKGITTALGPA